MYLESHPYKRDGLNILIVTPEAARFAADLATMLRRGEWKETQLTIHLATPKHLWGRAIAFFEEVPSENRLSGEDALFPPLQLLLHELKDGILRV